MFCLPKTAWPPTCSGLSELILGSVSNYVLHHAPCSVLTLQSLKNTTTQSPTDESKQEVAGSK